MWKAVYHKVAEILLARYPAVPRSESVEVRIAKNASGRPDLVFWEALHSGRSPMDIPKKCCDILFAMPKGALQVTLDLIVLKTLQALVLMRGIAGRTGE
jgi:hypothetical protein